MADNQPTKKWAGKYESPEAMEQGLLNLVGEFDRIKAEAREKEQRLFQAEAQAKVANEVLEQMRTRAPEPTLRSEGGELDDRAIQTYIDSKLGKLEQRIAAIPEVVDSRLMQVLAPFNAAQTAKGTYLASHPDYDDAPIQRYMATNPGVNRTFQRLLANPETAEEAYKYAHDMYKAGLPKQSAVDEGKKRDAQAPQPSSGPSLQATEGGTSLDELRAMSRRAQTTISPEDELAFARQFFKGTKVLENIDALTPDWVKEHKQG